MKLADAKIHLVKGLSSEEKAYGKMIIWLTWKRAYVEKSTPTCDAVVHDAFMCQESSF